MKEGQQRRYTSRGGGKATQPKPREDPNESRREREEITRQLRLSLVTLKFLGGDM